MMSLFKAITTKHGLRGGGLVGFFFFLKCEYVCLVVSRRDKSMEKLDGREITRQESLKYS